MRLLLGIICGERWRSDEEKPYTDQPKTQMKILHLYIPISKTASSTGGSDLLLDHPPMMVKVQGLTGAYSKKFSLDKAFRLRKPIHSL
ncbi:hypothetical protein K2X85_20845 [bacterium]|nr:hypothetical protein [bacterium]